MEILLLILILGVFMVPSFLMARTQKKRQAEMVGLQNSVQAGDKIVTVSGFHATIVDTQESTLTLELSPGVEATMERAGVMRKVEPVEPPTGEIPGSAGSYWDDQDNQPRQTEDGGYRHPENSGDHPENFGDGEQYPDRSDHR
ncbi:preprotein translocase subunit YajC [Corynebacterium cystitidis]|uniref:preprotein translocase subunit YajC n=1 Tax=Corynebacterium cystitidis TaxID=35757 RepID=UPI00211EE148|nr:preprotein translocase subunit YajC [Corynebacterium cystitidis]